MDFWQTVEILNRRKWIILLSGLVAIVLTLGALRLIGSKWQASVPFIAPAGMNNSGSGAAGSEGDSTASVEDAHDQALILAAILKSQAVTQPVLTKFAPSQVPLNLLQNIDFLAVGPRLYTLQVTDTSRPRATQLANGLADRFLSVYHGLRTQQAQRTVHLLETQLHNADKDLAASQRRYDDYRDQHGIVGDFNKSVESAMTSLQSAQNQRDAALIKLMDAQARLHKKQSQVIELPAPSPLEVVAASPLAQKHEELIQADLQLAQLRQSLTDEHPSVQAALAHRKEVASQWQVLWNQNAAALTRSHNTALVGLQAEIRALLQEVAGDQAEVTMLNQEIAEHRAQIQQFKGVDSPLGSLLGTVGEKSENRNGILARLTAARQELDRAERQNPLAIMTPVNEFNPPVNMSQGRTKKLLLIAPLAAIVCACLVIIGLDSVDRRLKTVRQADLSLPKGVIAAIPQPMTETGYANMARITELQPQSIHSEAYRFLGLHLLTAPKSEVRSLMVLAAKAEQGSTTTLTNLGITLAQAGKRVILMDANIRTAELHTVFGVENGFGFTDLLRDPTPETLAEVLHETSVPGLSFVTSGTAPENPWELFRSQNLVEMSHLVHQNADYVLYDTPSSLMFTDALNLAPVVDAAILCVRAQEPLTGTEERLVELLEHAHVKVLGSVLNDVPANALDGYQNYRHYYEPLAGPAPAPKGTAAIAPILLSRPDERPENRN